MVDILLYVNLHSPKLIVAGEIEVSVAQEGAGGYVAGGNLKLTKNPKTALVKLNDKVHPPCPITLIFAIVAAGKAEDILLAVNEV